MAQIGEFKNKAYLNRDVTLETAQQEFAGYEPHNIAFRSGVEYLEEENEFIVPCLNETYRVHFPSGKVYQHGKEDKEIPLDIRILILHYLNSAEGVSLKGELISFKELPSGQVYINPFYNRAIRPLIKYFGEQPDKFIAAGLSMGGEKVDKGDAGVKLNLFTMVPITLILWLGDDEFPPAGNILFDASAPNYLPTEDYAVAGGMVVYEMKRIAGL